jgi:hypothetical protein
VIPFPGLGAESGGRLVQEQQVGLLGEALGDQDTPALTTGEFAQLAVCQVGDTQSFHGGVDGRPVVAGQPPPQPALAPAAHPHGLPRGEGECATDGAALRDEGRRAALRVLDLSRNGVDHAGEDAEQGDRHPYREDEAGRPRHQLLLPLPRPRPPRRALVLGTNGVLHVIDPETGKVDRKIDAVADWTEPLHRQQPRPTLFVRDHTAYVSEPGKRQLHAFDLDSGTRWRP